jgi:regulator of cell morphogenesis and NO signaling
MSSIINEPIGEIVRRSFKASEVFRKHHIDFCCGGKKTLEDVCKEKNIDTGEMEAELNKVLSSPEESVINFDEFPPDLLADYIEKKHHRYIEHNAPVIGKYLDKLVAVHGKRHPELEEIRTEFLASAGELAKHMKKEELVLFPFIRKMVLIINGKATPQAAPFGTVLNPISMMMQEHDVEGDRFRKLAQLTDNYTPPADACNTYRVTFEMLKDYENDLHTHIHIENNILFSKAVEMEKELFKDSSCNNVN